MSTFLFLRFSSGLVNRQPVFLIPLAIASMYSKPSSEVPAVISCATVLPDSLHTLLWLDLPVLYSPQRLVRDKNGFPISLPKRKHLTRQTQSSTSHQDG